MIHTKHKSITHIIALLHSHTHTHTQPATHHTPHKLTHPRTPHTHNTHRKHTLHTHSHTKHTNTKHTHNTHTCTYIHIKQRFCHSTSFPGVRDCEGFAKFLISTCKWRGLSSESFYNLSTLF